MGSLQKDEAKSLIVLGCPFVDLGKEVKNNS